MRRSLAHASQSAILAATTPVRPETISAGIDYQLGPKVTDLLITGGEGIARRSVITGNALSNTITGSIADELIRGLDGNDTLVGGGGRDRLYGGQGNDTMVGGDRADRLFGGDGNDVLVGGGGSDLLSGGNGNDVLAGGAGRNTLIGGAGDDVFSSSGPARVTGGTGADHFQNGTAGGWRFIYTSAADSAPEARDVFDNFLAYDAAHPRAHDVIDLSAMDADTTQAGMQHFSLVGGPSGTAGELWYIRVFIGAGEDGYVLSQIFGDVDGDGVADMEIRVPAIIAEQNLIL